MHKLLVLLIVLQFVTTTGYAQEVKKLLASDSLSSKFWTIEDGLPINTVNDVAQDDDGYLWFTTYDGIVRFDGIEFKTFNHSNTPEIPHNRATEIYKQDGVGIWVSMEYEGVLLIKENSFEHFGVNDGFSKSDVTQIYEDSDARMFFVTHDGLYVYEDQKFSRYFTGKDEYQDTIRFLYEDRDGSKWIATNNGLIHISENGKKEYSVSEEEASNRFFSVFRSSEGSLYASSTSGLYEVKNGEITSPKELKEIENIDVYRMFEYQGATFLSSYNGIYTLKGGKLSRIVDTNRKGPEAYHKHLIDSEGLLWLIGDRGTLSVYKDGVLSTPQVIKETGLSYFISVYEDREKNIWITTPREGIIRIKKAVVRTIGKKEGLSEDNILGLLKDSRGRYWVGTRGGGLNLIEGNKVTIFTEHREIASNIVQSIAEDSLGNIWVGHYQKGINKISDNGIEYYLLGEKFDLNNIHALYTARDGQLWVGSYGGLIKFNQEGQNHTIYTKEEGLRGSKIRYITEAEDRSLWVGTLDGGVSHFKDNTFTNYSKEDGLSSDNVRSIYIDKTEHVVWVGTENDGLNRIKDGEIDYIGINDGLPDYNIHWISEDDVGWLWMSSNKGVFKIHKSSLNEYLDGNSASFRMTVFGSNDGMRNQEGNGSIQEAGIKNSNGTFWIATQEGVAIFESGSTTKSSWRPKVIVQDVVAKGESYAGDNIVFDSNINDFEIKIHAITFQNPSKTKYKYAFTDIASKGMEEWIEIGSERNVQFTDISPGEYEFTVVASTSDGMWLDEKATVFITITAKYYEKWWFYILCVILAVSIFIGGWKFKQKRLIQKQEKLKAIIQEQTELIRREKKEVEVQKGIIEEQAKNLELSNNEKDKFFSIIAHDLRTPFQAMIGYSDYLYSNLENIDEQELKESIGIIKDSTGTLLKLTENLLEWARLQSGNSKPQLSHFPLNDIINKNKLLYEQAATQKKIDLMYEIDSEIVLHADYNMVDTIIRNLISNALKFTASEGKISVEATCIANDCEIRISDNGIGMTEKMLNEVLSLGKNTSRRGTNNEVGTGLGLVLCKEMIELNRGELKIESEVGKGSTFIIKFPTG